MRLQEKYKAEIRAKLQEEFAYPNPMMIPKVTKVSVNIGLGEAVQNAKVVEAAVGDLTKIAGQKPVVTRARKSIAGFKLREGMPIACAVTLRRDRMWEFLDRLITVALPRIRDFRGIKSKLDGRGNYTLGISEQSIFPEIVFDRIEFQQGMDITFVTSAGTDEQGYMLLKELGMPFVDRSKKD